MTTDTEALRRAFEAFSLDGGLTPGDLEWNGRFYIVPFTQDEWLTFQAGHAAAKAETAAPVVGRWYFVTNDGAATLCVDEADARGSAAEADIAFPRMAPHLVTQLVSASQLAAAVAAATETTLRAGRFTKKPLTIDAWLIDFDNKPLPAWVDAGFVRGSLEWSPDGEGLYINTLEGCMLGSNGDYLIQGVKGELYACKPDIFATTYTPTHLPPYPPQQRSRQHTKLPMAWSA